MTSARLAILIASCILAPCALAPSPAHAQQANPGFSGSTRSSVAGCPYIIWRLARAPDGHIHGIAYYSDLSGLSTVTGTRDASGNFELDVTPTQMGSGPSGHVTGHAGRNGAINARLVGDGCANATVSIKPLADLNRYPTGQ